MRTVFFYYFLLSIYESNAIRKLPESNNKYITWYVSIASPPSLVKGGKPSYISSHSIYITISFIFLQFFILEHNIIHK